MSEFYLVRHGQASFAAANYDKLSPLGHQQSAWLGEYFRCRNIYFGAVITGEMRRHKETATSLCNALEHTPEHLIHTGFNEFDFHTVFNAYLQHHPEQRPAEGAPRQLFYTVLKQAMAAWIQGELDGAVNESWQDFEDRVAAALTYTSEICSRQRRVLVVSSGGAMAMSLKHVLGVDNHNVINLNMQMKNTGVSHFYCNKGNKGAIRLHSFNNIPHLDMPGRTESITYS